MTTPKKTKQGDLTIPNFSKNRIIIESIVFLQPADSCEDSDADQKITVEFDDAGDGFFWRIKTDGWAVDANEASNYVKVLDEIARQNTISIEGWI